MADLFLEKYPKVAKTIKKRFRYVFVDEAQDTDDMQFSIIEKLFENNATTVQKIGDNNQAIFNFQAKKESCWKVKDSYIEIKDTKRLPKKIADVATKVALNPQNLSGIDTILIKPTIIVFDDKDIEKIIPTFEELIIKSKLHEKVNPIFKVVAGVAKESEKGHVLSDYFPNYKKTGNKFEGMDFATQLQGINDKTVTAKSYRNIVLPVVHLGNHNF